MQDNGNPAVWEEPPSTKGRRTEESKLALELKANPGRWARVTEYENYATAGAAAAKIRGGRIRRWEPAGSFEATCRKVDGKGVVYARYVGEGGEQR